jgi:RimJ/RimL family protein N-acetyltransferase
MRLVAGDAIVRPWNLSDAKALAAAANDRRISINLRDVFPFPYSVADAKGFIGMAMAMSPQTYFAIEVDGHAAGGIGYTLQGDVSRIAAEVGYWLGVAYWGHGIMTAAVRAVSEHAFATHADLRRLYAVPFAGNPASARVLEKAGYTREGTMRDSVIKDGRILDSWLYARLR